RRWPGAVRRVESEKGAAVGGAAYQYGEIPAPAQRGGPGGDCHRLSTARPSRGPVRVPGVYRSPEHGVCRLSIKGELGNVGFREKNSARGLEATNGRRISRGYIVGKQP